MHILYSDEKTKLLNDLENQRSKLNQNDDESKQQIFKL